MNILTIATALTFVFEIILALIVISLLDFYLRRKKKMEDLDRIFLQSTLSILIVAVIGFGNFAYIVHTDLQKETIYDKVASKTLFWTDSYKRDVLKDSAWAVREKYKDQWDSLASEWKKTQYGTVEYDSLGAKMDSVYMLLDSAQIKYDRLPD